MIQPPKINKIEKELKKKNAGEAEKIVSMLKQKQKHVQDVVSTKNANSSGTISISSESNTIDSTEITNFSGAAIIERESASSTSIKNVNSLW